MVPYLQTIVLPESAAGADVCFPLINASRERIGTGMVACARYAVAVPGSKARDQVFRSVRLSRQYLGLSTGAASDSNKEKNKAVQILAKNHRRVEITVRM